MPDNWDSVPVPERCGSPTPLFLSSLIIASLIVAALLPVSSANCLDAEDTGFLISSILTAFNNEKNQLVNLSSFALSCK